MPLKRLADVAADYDALLCDLWGVVHDGKRAFEGAVEALCTFRAGGGKVVLISNVPKLRKPIPGQLDRLGVPRAAWDAVVTSGDAIHSELARRAPGRMHLFGPSADRGLWAGLDFQLVELDSADFVLATALGDTEHPRDYAEDLKVAHSRGLDLVCANPDVVVRFGDRLYWCAGALVQEYEQLGGTVVLAGKPHPPIYHLAFEELARLFGRAPDIRRVLAIGDGPGTDVLGANRHGLDCLFIGGGIERDTVGSDGDLDLVRVSDVLERAGTHARYAARELR